MCPSRAGRPPAEMPGPAYELVVLDDEFPVFMEDPPPTAERGPLYRVEPALGATEVVLYSDDHNLTLADLGGARIRRLVEVWADRYAELGSREEVAYVLVFENKTEAAARQHPHGQIYAYPEIPPRPLRELTTAVAHLEAHGTCVFCDVVARERAEGVRVVDENSSFVAFVPFAARFPYEVHISSRRHVASLLDLTDPERDALAGLLESVLRAYDGLFGFSLPYVMVLHQAPTDDGQWQAVSHLHIELTPPNRAATMLSHLGGAELGGGSFLNDTAPEETAAALRGLTQAWP